MRLSRFYLGLIACAVLAVLASLFVEFTGVIFFRHAETAFGAELLVLGYGVVGLSCAAVYENGKAPRLMRSGMLVGAIALGSWLAYMFTPELQRTMLASKLFILPTMWAAFVMLAGGLMLLPMHTRPRRLLRLFTAAMILVLATYIVGAMWFYPDFSSATGRSRTEADWQRVFEYEENAWQLGGILAILTGGALVTTIIVGLLGTLTGVQRPAAAAGNRVGYWFKCPRCSAEQQALTGEHRCVRCQLRAKVELT